MNIAITVFSLCIIGNEIAPNKSKKLSEREIISRLGNEDLLQMVFDQQETIKQKDRALKLLLARFNGSSHLPRNWLNSEIVFNELLNDTDRLRAEVEGLLERKNILLDEKDNQLAAKDRKIKLLRMLCCAPMYVITLIEEVRKQHNLVHDEDSRDAGQSWLNFVSRGADAFAGSLREQLKSCKRGMSPEKFCDGIRSLLSNAKAHFSHLTIEFQRALGVGDELPAGKSEILKIEESQLTAFNILLKALGFSNVKVTEDGELSVPLCEDKEHMEKYYNYSRRSGSLPEERP